MSLEKANSIVTDGNLTPKGYYQLTTLSSAVSVPGSGRICWLLAETQPVRIRDDGTPPTNTVGFLLPVNVCFKYTGDPRELLVIEAVAGAVLNVLSYD